MLRVSRSKLAWFKLTEILWKSAAYHTDNITPSQAEGEWYGARRGAGSSKNSQEKKDYHGRNKALPSTKSWTASGNTSNFPDFLAMSQQLTAIPPRCLPTSNSVPSLLDHTVKCSSDRSTKVTSTRACYFTSWAMGNPNGEGKIKIKIKKSNQWLHVGDL